MRVPHHVMNIIFGNNVLHRLLQFMQKRRSSVRYGNGRDTLEKYYYLQQYLFDRRAQIWRDQIAYMNSSDNRIVYSSNPVVPQVSSLLCQRKYWPDNKAFMKNSINNKFIFIFYSTERIETIRLSLKVFSIEITMRTFTLSVAVILLLSIPQDGEAKPLFFGFLSKLFGGGKKKNNGGGNFINLMPHDLTYKFFFKS